MKNILIDISGKLENSNYNLVKDMLLTKRDDFDRILLLLNKLKEGIYNKIGKKI